MIVIKSLVRDLIISIRIIIVLFSFIRNSETNQPDYHVDFGARFVWAIKLNVDTTLSRDKLDKIANDVAKECGLTCLGQIGALSGHYLFKVPSDSQFGTSHDTNYNTLRKNNSVPNIANGFYAYSGLTRKLRRLKRQLEFSITSHVHVDWHEFQFPLKRSQRSRILIGEQQEKKKRSPALDLTTQEINFNDPFFPKQWHLANVRNPGSDINVTEVWKYGITGRGVTVAVIDDGLQWNNIDIKENYSAEGSFDLNDNDDDPSPSESKLTNHHGTRCAGEIAGVANNSVCGVGVAYRSKIAGIRILDGTVTDASEAAAFTKRIAVNDVYSCSWGPQDDGKTVDGPQRLAVASMHHGIKYGRRGYGSIYVVASGNGGRVGDNCNYDGYANSIYTVTVGAVDERGSMPSYAEECASMLAVTYSSGSRDIVTTDWTAGGGNGCTESHSGTSAAAPLAAAMIALMLEVRPCLTWRDVQYIIVMTAVRVDEAFAGWSVNAAGLSHSHKHGFGLLSAWRLVNTAKVWKTLPWQTMYSTGDLNSEYKLYIPPVGSLLVNVTVTERDLEGYTLNTLEYVHVTITLTHQRRGDVEIILTCPSGTQSLIGATRALDNSTAGFDSWTFSTVRCWGEKPEGVWSLRVTDKGQPFLMNRGKLIKWKLTLYGSHMVSEEVQSRMKLVEEAASGQYLRASYQLPCQSPPVLTPPFTPVSNKILKILSLTGAFILFISIYQTLEYIFCYDEEKREHRESMTRSSPDTECSHSQQLNETHVPDSNSNGYTQLSQTADDFEINQTDTPRNHCINGENEQNHTSLIENGSTCRLSDNCLNQSGSIRNSINTGKFDSVFDVRNGLGQRDFELLQIDVTGNSNTQNKAYYNNGFSEHIITENNSIPNTSILIQSSNSNNRLLSESCNVTTGIPELNCNNLLPVQNSKYNNVTSNQQVIAKASALTDCDCPAFVNTVPINTKLCCDNRENVEDLLNLNQDDLLNDNVYDVDNFSETDNLIATSKL